MCQRFAIVVLLLIECSATASPSDRVNLVVGAWLAGEGRGDPSSASSPLISPFGVDFDAEGNMTLVELEGGRVHRMDVTGQLTQVAGNGKTGYAGDGQTAAHAVFNGMHNVAVTPAGDVYIADSWNHCVRRIDHRSGIVTTIAGDGQAGYSGDGGPASQARFDFVMCIALSPDHQQLFIADLNNRRIRAIDLEKGTVRLVAGNGQTGVPPDGALAPQAPLVDPRAVASDSQHQIYVLERNGHCLRRIGTDGKITTVVGTGRAGYRDGAALQAQLNSPKHICVDDDDKVYIADDQNRRIRCYDPQREVVETVLGEGQGDARIRLSHPHGVAVDKQTLYVVDTGNNRVLKMGIR